MKWITFILTIVLFFALTYHVKAETYLQLHTLSYHSSRDANFNEANYGVGIRHYMKNEKFDYITVGLYRNSEFNQSVYSGAGWEWPINEFKVGLSAGLITGYKMNSVLPYVVANIRYKRLNIILSPFLEPVVHLTIDVMKF